MMEDSFGRKIEYLRVSLTDRCNYRCLYCMGDNGIELKSHNEMLSLEETFEVIEAFHSLGGKKVRFTGGEPLVRKGAVGLIQKVKTALPDLSLNLTTNGVFLPQYIGDLAKSLDGINISIDSLDKDIYANISRGGNLNDAILAVKCAKDYNVKNVKINVVLLKGVNDEDVNRFIDFGNEYDVFVRYIELMPFFGHEEAKKYFISADSVAKNNGLVYEETKGLVSYYRGKNGSIGFITPMSHNFCATCNRLRLTADGKILPCLHGSLEIDVKPYLNGNLAEVIKLAVANKPKCHRLAEGNLQTREMNKIGG